MYLLCGHIEHVYIYIYWINITNILMGFKISCQVEGGGKNFKKHHRFVTFLFLSLKVHMFTGGLLRWKR